MLYIIDQDGLSVIPIKKEDVIETKQANYRFYVRKQRKKDKDGSFYYDWLGTYGTRKEAAEAVKRIAEARIGSFPDGTFKMPRNGFLEENH